MLLLISHGLFLLMTNFCFQNTKATDGLRLKKKISHKLIDTMPRGELCAPSGAMVDLPVPSGQLCFGKTTHGDWQITRHILGATNFECV